MRVVCPDRPGIGRSDPHPERTIAGYAADVTGLADAMGFERFAVLGYSGGGSYALACGAKLPERVSAVGIMAGVGPLDRPGARESLTKADQMLIDLSIKRPLLARLITFGFSKVARFAPSVVLKTLSEELSEPDRLFLERRMGSKAGADLISTIVEAFRQGSGGPVVDIRLLGQPWGFPLEEVSVPVHIWHGENDLDTPIHHAEDMEARLAHAKLHRLKNTGHFSIQDHYGPMLDTLLP